MGNPIIVWDPDKKSSETLESKTFEQIGARERRDLEEWIKQNPDILGERLFIVTSEFDKFEKSQKRLDLLALDEAGKLVVVELKRDAAGTLADPQAIRYAASCSALLPEHVIAMRAKYADVSVEIAKQEILDFLQEDDPDAQFTVLDNKPRILIAAGGFDDQQITTSVLWLRSFGIDMSCVEISAYRVNGDKRLFLVPRVLIPLPETRNYTENIEIKEIEQSQSRISATQREYKIKNEQILAFFKESASGLGPATVPSGRTIRIPTDHQGISFAWWQHGQPEKVIDVAIHMESPSRENNQRLAGFLKSHFDEIKTATGEQPTVEAWGANFWRLYLRHPREPWTDETAKWAAETMLKLIRVARPLIDEYYTVTI